MTPKLSDFQNKDGIQVKEEIVDGNLFYIVSYIYNDSELWKDEVNFEARGLTFDSTGKIVSRPFEKFFNINENQFTQFKYLDFTDAEYFEKLDGCCHEDTKIITQDGIKTIKDICEEKYLGAILGYDHSLMQPIETFIIGHSIVESKNNWYDIELDNGEIVTLTANHLIWCNDLQKYIPVEKLSVGDDVEII